MKCILSFFFKDNKYYYETVFFFIQSQPVLKLQTEDDEQTNGRVLTCFLLPQQGLGSLGECQPHNHVLCNYIILEGCAPCS